MSNHYIIIPSTPDPKQGNKHLNKTRQTNAKPRKALTLEPINQNKPKHQVRQSTNHTKLTINQLKHQSSLNQETRKLKNTKANHNQTQNHQLKQTSKQKPTSSKTRTRQEKHPKHNNPATTPIYNISNTTVSKNTQITQVNKPKEHKGPNCKPNKQEADANTKPSKPLKNHQEANPQNHQNSANSVLYHHKHQSNQNTTNHAKSKFPKSQT